MNIEQKKEAVRWAYRLFLNREPESENVVDFHAKNLSDYKTFMELTIGSDEFRIKNGKLFAHDIDYSQIDIKNISINNNCVFCIPTVGRFEDVYNLIMSCESSSVKPSKYIILDKTKKDIYSFLKNKGIDLNQRASIFVTKHITSLANGWNFFIDLASYEDTIIISNEDLTLEKDTIRSFLVAEVLNPNISIFLSETESRTCLFGIKKRIINTVGYFDETFGPIYYEDSDFLKRCSLKKEKHIICTGATTKTHIGNGTYKILDSKEEISNLNIALEKNRKKWLKKWGNNEQYTIPYNDVNGKWYECDREYEIEKVRFL